MSVGIRSIKRIRTVPILSSSIKATRKIGEELGKSLPEGTVLALEGDLGSGKTVFVQGLAKGLNLDPHDVRSPTFALIQEHRGKVSLCHADLYRLALPEIVNLGLEEYWQKTSQSQGLGWIIAIEWADKAENLLPSDALKIQFEIVSEKGRKITFSGEEKWEKILNKCIKFKNKK